MGKDLKDKAINIKGKQYVLVSDRVIYFNETYPEGCITTELVSSPTSEMIIVKAIIYPNVEQMAPDGTILDRRFTGYSQAIIGDGLVNKTAALENAETSAVGRALAMMGIGVIESIASADEINKAQGSSGVKLATDKQVDFMRSVASDITGFEEAEDLDAWIEDVLTLRPQKVPIYKVSDAVNKLKQQKEVVNVQEDIVAEVTDKDIKDLKDGRLPY